MPEIDWKLAEQGEAYLSDDRAYRYALSRIWAPAWSARLCLIIGLNPSTADETQLDATLRRCIRFAHSFGYDGFWMGNLFAYRTKDPKEMRRVADPVGRDNDGWLTEMARWVRPGNVIAAWGAHGGHLRRDAEVKRLLGDYRLRCFGTTKDGHPKHPLYLPSETPLVTL